MYNLAYLSNKLYIVEWIILLVLYKLLFSRGFYFREFREPDPRENFHFNSCLFNYNIRKIAKLTTRELPHLVQKRENNCTRK